MIFIGPISSIFDIATFALMWYVFGANAPTHQGLFQSGWFIESLLTQTLIVHMIRTAKVPFIQSRATWPVLALTSVIMRRVFGTLRGGQPGGAPGLIVGLACRLSGGGLGGDR